MKNYALFTLGLFLFGISPLVAMDPPSAEQWAKYRLDGSLGERIAAAKSFGNHRVNPRLVRNFRSRFETMRREALGLPGVPGDPASPPPGDPMIAGELRSLGVSNVFVLLIDFSDYPAGNSAVVIDDKLFGNGSTGYPYESLSTFYRRSSYGLLEIRGTTLGWYRPAFPRSAVATNTTGRESLIREALLHFDDQGHDFTRYDNDGDGDIDYFLVIWTGPAGEWASFWWGYYTSYSKSLILDGKQFRGTGYSWQWESRPYPGTFKPSTAIHETGHALGLPDYYDYDSDVGPKGGMGGLDVMDRVWGDHNGFSKMILGWLTPRVFADGNRIAYLKPAAAAGDAVIFWPKFSLDDPFSEFFMVQNRSRTGNDIALPADGLLVFHIDATMDAWGYFLYDNSYTNRKLIRLMEADGLEEIEQESFADAGDYYVPGATLTWATTPNSNAYAGFPTAYLDSILQTNMNFSFRVGFERNRAVERW